MNTIDKIKYSINDIKKIAWVHFSKNLKFLLQRQNKEYKTSCFSWMRLKCVWYMCIFWDVKLFFAWWTFLHFIKYSYSFVVKSQFMQPVKLRVWRPTTNAFCAESAFKHSAAVCFASYENTAIPTPTTMCVRSHIN